MKAELPTCCFRCRFTLSDVLSAQEENQLDDSQLEDDEIEVVVLPPDEGGITDEDSDMSDDEATGTFIHLPRRILNAEAETPSLACTVPAPEAQQQPAKRKKKAPRNWGKKILPSEQLSEPASGYGPSIVGYLNATINTPLDAFFSFFSKNLVNEITQQTMIYAQQRGKIDFVVTIEEVVTFIGILIFSGYTPVPYRRLYWSVEPDVHNDLVSASMRRNRFDEIMQFLHLADNSKVNSDRYYKVRPLFKAVNETFKQLPLQPNISIDESMIKYYGKHSTKQFNRGKPIRFGFKLFSLASPAGYLYHAEPYCGSDTHLEEESYGLGGNVVLTLVQYCDVPAGSRLYFDNWFTSLSLLDRLKADGIGGTGTIRVDRCEKTPLQSKKNWRKKEEVPSPMHRMEKTCW